MSVTLDKIYPPHPTPTRALGFFPGFNEKVYRLCYCVDTLVYQRGVDNIFDCEIYNQHQGKTTCASYSPSGRWIASADEEGHLRVWTPQNKDKTLQIEARPIAGPVCDMSWTEDSERIAVVGQGAKSYGCALNATTGSSLGEVQGHTGPVRTVALRAQRPFRMVTAGDDCKHVYYKGPPFKFDHTKNDHDKFISCARFAPDGSVFVTVGLDGRVCVYDGQSGEIKNTHKMPTGITACCFSPDSKQLLLTQMDGKVLAVNVESGEIAQTWNVGSEVHQQQAGVLWTSKQKMSIGLNGDFNFLLDDGSIKTERGHTSCIVAATPIEGGFASADTCGRVLFWKYGDIPYAVFGEEGSGLPACCGICTLGDGNVAVTREDGALTILNKENASVIKSLTISKKSTGPLVASGNTVFTYSEKNLLIIGDDVKTIPLDYVPTAIAISVDGQEIAVGGADKLVHLYDTTGNEKGKIEGLFKECCAIAYSPDGLKIAASSQNKEIIVWNRDNVSTPFHEGWRYHSLAITKILWMSDNIGLVTVAKDRSIRLWSLEKKRRDIELARAHEQQINDAFWINETTLLTVGHDGAVRTWNIAKIE